MFRDL